MREIMTGANPVQPQEGSRLGRRLAGVLIAASALVAGGNMVQADSEPTPPTAEEIEAFREVFSESPAAIANVCADLDVVEARGAVEVFRFDNGEGMVVPDVNSADAVDNTQVPSPDYRISTDSLSNGFVTDRSNPQGLLDELGDKLCESPLETVTHLVALAHANLGDSIDAATVNPLLAQFNVPEDQINDIASELTPVYESDLGRPLTDEEVAENIIRIRKNENYASLVISILEKMQVSPIEGNQQISASYHLSLENGVPIPQFVDGQMVLPEVVYDPSGYGDNPETANIDETEVLKFEATEKDGECVIGYGVNPHDLRPVGVEGDGCESVVDVPEQPEEPNTTVPGTTEPGTTIPSGTVPEGTTTVPGVGPKEDDNETPAGVPGQNGGSGTSDSGPTGPGEGPSGQPVDSDGSVGNEVLPSAPATTATPTTTRPSTVPATTSPAPASTNAPATIPQTNNTTPVGTTPGEGNV